MIITRKEIEKLRESFDPEARIYFESLSPQEQLSILFSMSASNSNRLAIVEQWQINFERDSRRYRSERERKESNDDPVSTTQKILKAIETHDANKFNYAVWFRDRVLPQVITVITLAILALAFRAQLP